MQGKRPSFKHDEPAPKLKRRPPKRLRAGPRPPLTIAQILEWTDAHYARTGKWPNTTNGSVHENQNEKWQNIAVFLLEIAGLP